MARKKRDGMINLVNKDDPNYRPNYGSTYTKRQMDVLAGIIPLEFVPINTKANRITKKTIGESAPVSAVLYSAWTFLSSYALIVKLRVLIKTRPLTSAQGRPYCEATSKNRKPCAADTARGFRHDTPAESETLISLCRSVRWYIRSRILLPPGNTPHITNKRPHTHKNMISGNPPVRSSI